MKTHIRQLITITLIIISTNAYAENILSISPSINHNFYLDSNVDAGFGIDIKATHENSGLYIFGGAENFDFTRGDQALANITTIKAGIGERVSLIDTKKQNLNIYGQIGYCFANTKKEATADEAIKYHFRETLTGSTRPIWPNPQYSVDLNNYFEAEIGIQFIYKWTEFIETGFSFAYAYSKPNLYIKYWSDEYMREREKCGKVATWWETNTAQRLDKLKISFDVLRIKF